MNQITVKLKAILYAVKNHLCDGEEVLDKVQQQQNPFFKGLLF